MPKSSRAPIKPVLVVSLLQHGLLSFFMKSTLFSCAVRKKKSATSQIYFGCISLILKVQDVNSDSVLDVSMFDSELLERLCLSLYDVLRPLIIHVIHLETLSELCGILKTEMLEDHVHHNGKWKLLSSPEHRECCSVVLINRQATRTLGTASQWHKYCL